MVSWAPSKNIFKKKKKVTAVFPVAGAEARLAQTKLLRRNQVIFQLMSGCPVKVTGTWWAQPARRAQQSVAAAVGVGEAGESKPPNLAFRNKRDAHKKHILLDDESRTDFATRARNNNLSPAF